MGDELSKLCDHKPRAFQVNGAEVFVRDLSIAEFEEYQKLCDDDESDNTDAALWLVSQVWVDAEGQTVAKPDTLKKRLGVKTLLEFATRYARDMSTPIEDVAKN